MLKDTFVYWWVNFLEHLTAMGQMVRFLNFLFLLTLVSCASPLKHIKNENFIFSESVITDRNVRNKLMEVIAARRLENPDKLTYSALVLFSKENIMDKPVNSFAITYSYGLSDLYEYPCSGYAVFDGVLILIYDKTKGYINPTNYPKSFLEIARKYLFDDWTLYKVNCSDDITILGGYVSNQANLIAFKGNRELVKKHYQFSVGKLFYGEDNFRFTNYYNLDNFRIVCPYQN